MHTLGWRVVKEEEVDGIRRVCEEKRGKRRMAITLHSSNVEDEELSIRTIIEAGKFNPSWTITVPRQTVTVGNKLYAELDKSIELIKRLGQKVT